jgi:O-antigen/teichoic acid export membrane protein
MSNNISATLTLRQRALKSGSWTFLGYALNQFLRFGGNLILTRLLFPEAFGMMAIVQTVILGATMLSDMGVAPCIVQNKRGEDQGFLNTAWSLQVVRGAALWGLMWLVSEPLASLYQQPMLAELLPAAALTALITGFNSTKLATADRRLDAPRVTLIEVGSYALGLTITLLWAWADHTVWALVWGSVIGAMVKMLASHLLLHGMGNRFQWDRESAAILFGFGQWIFVSSLITFLAGEGNKLLIGAMLDIHQLAFYTLASTMSLMFMQATQQISAKVLFPSYAEIVRNRPQDLSAALEKSRLAIILPGWLVAVFFVFLGDEVMRLLYDARYAESGAMLEMLAIGTLAGIISLSYAGVLMAKGMVGMSALLQAIQVAIQITAMLVGHQLNGLTGLMTGLAAANWLMYLIIAMLFSRLSLWHPRVDLPFLGMSAVVVFFATH